MLNARLLHPDELKTDRSVAPRWKAMCGKKPKAVLFR
jgi:hypothetical protein